MSPVAVSPVLGPAVLGPAVAGSAAGGPAVAGRAGVGGPAGLAGILAGGTVRSGGEIGAGDGVLPGTDLLPVLPALRDLLPGGALQRGSVVATGGWSLLCLALVAGPVASGAWCAAAGLPHLGVRAAADAGLDPARLLLIDDPGPNWPQVVASLLDGCDLVLLRPPERPSAQVRRKLEAVVRRYGAVLLVVGDWDGAQIRLRVMSQEWAGIGAGHGRLRARRARVLADGRGGWSRPRERWLWLPGPDGTISAVADSSVAAADGTGLGSFWLETSAG
ncbi:MAG TPA: hypothetical protein VN840_11650 [Streptosporangiaceae bacterium]|nr:hypothetical protein [Streptosporangiaceae bacterium]